MIKTTAQKIYIALIFIFMYAPIATLVVLSFNASKTRANGAALQRNGTLSCFPTQKSCRHFTIRS